MIGLSILIPVYEYNPTELIRALVKQGTDLPISFEIIVIDDASKIDFYSKWATPFDKAKSIQVTRLNQNIGRAAIRNTLIQKASFDWLLFLDSDTIPCRENYLDSYLTFLSSNYDCISGGTAYRKEQPEAIKKLRWEYGKAREEISAVKRNQKPFDTFTLNNLLIRKNVAFKFPLDHSILKYGHEDTLLGMTLAMNNSTILHIDNFVYHEGLDINDVFLAKVKESVSSLVDLHIQGKLLFDTRLIKLHKKLSRLKINGLLVYLIKPFIPTIEKNLLGPTPYLVYMDVLKYWHFENELSNQ